MTLIIDSSSTSPLFIEYMEMKQRTNVDFMKAQFYEDATGFARAPATNSNLVASTALAPRVSPMLNRDAILN